MYEWLKNLLAWAIQSAYNHIVDLVNLGITKIAGVWQFAIDIMPASMGLGTLQLPSQILDLLGYINWFIPLQEIVVCIYAYLAVYVVYISIKPILKFVRLA